MTFWWGKSSVKRPLNFVRDNFPYISKGLINHCCHLCSPAKVRTPHVWLADSLRWTRAGSALPPIESQTARVSLSIKDVQYNRYEYCGEGHVSKDAFSVPCVELLCCTMNNLTKVKCQLWGETAWWTSTVYSSWTAVLLKYGLLERGRSLAIVQHKMCFPATLAHKSKFYLIAERTE